MHGNHSIQFVLFDKQIRLTLDLSTKYVTTSVYRSLVQVVNRSEDALSANEKFGLLVFFCC